MIKKCFSQSLNNDGRVAFDEKQCLTPKQKEQARKNIGLDNVPTQDDIREIKNRLDNDETMIDDISNELESVSVQVETNTDNISTLQEDVLKAKSTVSAGKNIEVEEEVMNDGHTNYTISASSNYFEIDFEKYGIVEGDFQKGSDGHYTEEQYDIMYNNGMYITNAIKEAVSLGYSNIVFPKGKVISLTPHRVQEHSNSIIHFYDIHNTIVDFNYCTFKLKLDSTQKSKYYTYQASTSPSYDYSSHMFRLDCCTNVKLQNCFMIGDMYERSYIVDAEKKQEGTYGISMGRYCKDIYIENVDGKEFMGDIFSTGQNDSYLYHPIVTSLYPFSSINATQWSIRYPLIVHRWIQVTNGQNVGIASANTVVDNRENPVVSNNTTACSELIEIPDNFFDAPSPNYPSKREILWCQSGEGYLRWPTVPISENCNAIWWYDSEQNFISAKRIGFNSTVLTAPDNAKYFRFVTSEISHNSVDLADEISNGTGFTSYYNDNIVFEKCNVGPCQRGGLILGARTQTMKNSKFYGTKFYGGFTTDTYAITSEDSLAGLLILDNVVFDRYSFSARILGLNMQGIQANNCKNLSLIVGKFCQENFSSSIRNSTFLAFQFDYATYISANRNYDYRIVCSDCVFNNGNNSGINENKACCVVYERCTFNMLNAPTTSVRPVANTNTKPSIMKDCTIVMNAELGNIGNSIASYQFPIYILVEGTLNIQVSKDFFEKFCTTLDQYFERTSRAIILGIFGNYIPMDSNSNIYINDVNLNEIVKWMPMYLPKTTKYDTRKIENHDKIQLGTISNPTAISKSGEQNVIITNCGLISANATEISSLQNISGISSRVNIEYNDCKIYAIPNDKIIDPSSDSRGYSYFSDYITNAQLNTFISDGLNPYRKVTLKNMKVIGNEDGNGHLGYSFLLTGGVFNSAQYPLPRDYYKIECIDCDDLGKIFMTTNREMYGDIQTAWSYAFKRSGTIEERPWFVPEGFAYFDTTLGKMIYRHGFRYNTYPFENNPHNFNDIQYTYEPGWVDANGNDVTTNVQGTITVGDETYEYVKVGNYYMINRNLSNVVGESGTDYYDAPTGYSIIGKYYKRTGIDALIELLPEGWHIPTETEMNDIVNNYNSHNYLFSPWSSCVSDSRNTSNNFCRVNTVGHDKYGCQLYQNGRINNGTLDINTYYGAMNAVNKNNRYYGYSYGNKRAQSWEATTSNNNAFVVRIIKEV